MFLYHSMHGPNAVYITNIVPATLIALKSMEPLARVDLPHVPQWCCEPEWSSHFPQPLQMLPNKGEKNQPINVLHGMGLGETALDPPLFWCSGMKWQWYKFYIHFRTRFQDCSLNILCNNDHVQTGQISKEAACSLKTAADQYGLKGAASWRYPCPYTILGCKGDKVLMATTAP